MVGADDAQVWALLRGKQLSGKSKARIVALSTRLNGMPFTVVSDRILHC